MAGWAFWWFRLTVHWTRWFTRSRHFSTENSTPDCGLGFYWVRIVPWPVPSNLRVHIRFHCGYLNDILTSFFLAEPCTENTEPHSLKRIAFPAQSQKRRVLQKKNVSRAMQWQFYKESRVAGDGARPESRANFVFRPKHQIVRCHQSGWEDGIARS